MRYWINAGFLEVDQLVAVAREAERLGFEGIAMPDHLVFPERIDSAYPYSADGAVSWRHDAPWPDCWVAIGAMAAATERLRFTTGVFVAPLRDVFSLAKSVSTAAAFGPGRVSCGVGAGWLREEFDTVGQDFATRGPRMDEMLEVLRLLWSGEVAEFHGKHIDFDPLRMCPPVGHVPILIGGNTAPALRRAARNDGWIGTYTDPRDVARMVGEIAAQRTKDHQHGEFEILLSARPGSAKDASALDDLAIDGLSVDGIIVPVVALAQSSDSEALFAGLQQFATRWM